MGNKSVVVDNKQQLVDYLASGCKPKSDWRIGTEHEKFAFCTKSLRTLPYEGEKSVRALLENMSRFPEWEPVFEAGNIIALKGNDGSSVTLEPGGQVELSGAPLENIHQTCKEVGTHLEQAKKVAAELDVSFLGLGYQPKWSVDDIPWMPKGRYKIMREYMPKKGTLGLDMMKATCTVQVNLDFASETDMVRKFRTSLALQPIATALWANSPFRNGKPNGLLSFRSHIWTDTDPDRCGTLPFVFEDGFGFESYVDYMLNVPMYFVYRDGKYIDASGQSFKDFMAGKLPALPGERATLQDWEDHLTTAFPEVRLKKFLEMRGADGGPWNRLCALPAFWVGLLYDDQALDEAEQLVKDWSLADNEYLRERVPYTALNTEFKGQTIGDIAMDVLDIAQGGLKRRGVVNSQGQDESKFLEPLYTIAESGQTQAEIMLKEFETRWKGDIDQVFKDHAY
ncbi:glutamate--cysteine ligase [Terasakiella brassicae]|uniref:Glutamate--cysteine ligase n=1 Tax=Terasakiella brassicae TaxID=1634917 RepID=A0A917FDA4_9PROT|nr:glutamate--cysteine ligase [Terasakiella brassicae]GGF68303.1 glutamate--cysteine ligase [Terasakiella brassicae]